MWHKFRSLFRVTAIRLSIIYTLIFGLAAVGLVIYMTGATSIVLHKQYRASVDTEINGLSRIYQQAGINFVIRTLERRSRAPSANLYVIANPSGEIVAGNVPWVQNGVMSRIGWTGRPFRYKRYDGTDRNRDYRAIARILEFPNGMRILVGRDLSEHEGFRNIVGKSLRLALGLMVALGLLTWFFVGRRALKRMDQVSQSSMRIMAGDRSERLPVTGANDEFDRLSANLNLMIDRINNLDIGLKQMSDNIAHDLKTPITRLRNKADQAFAMKDDREGQQEAISEIISDCDQIVKTFDALLMISRVESGSTVAKFSTVDLSELVRDLHELYEAVAEEQNITLSFEDSDVKNVVLEGNRELLSQAVSNLIDNAIKYGAPKSGNPEIDIKITSNPSSLIIVVSDNGMGIPEKDLERVKDRFVRLDKSRNKPGNGLGLSLVAAIAELHGGTLELENREHGFEAMLALPRKGRKAS